MIFVQKPTRTATEEGLNNDPFDALWTITLSEAPTSDVIVSYRYLPGTGFVSSRANEIGDAYNSSGLSNTVTFEAGETSKQVGLNIDADSVVENDESVIIEVFGVSGENVQLEGDAPVLRSSSFILNDDGTGVRRLLDVSSPIIKEGDAGTRKMVFDLALSQAATDPITISYATIDGTAKAGTDFTAKSGTETFGQGQTELSIEVDILSDTVLEATEAFTLDITDPGDGSLFEIRDGIGTILNDDPDGPVVSVAGSFSPEAGFNDPYDLFWTITLSEAATSDVTVSYRYLQSIGTGDVSSRASPSDAYNSSTGLSSTVTFAAGETSRRVALNIDADDQVEFDESFVIELFNVTGDGAVLENDAPVLRATSFILDDEGTGVKRMLDVSSPVMREGDDGTKLMVFELLLSRPSREEIEVNYKTIDGTATSGSDYTSTSGVITFKPGQTLASVEVPVTGDMLEEASETLTLEVSSDSDELVSLSSGVGTIANDDPDVPVVSISGSSTPEAETQDPYDLLWTVTLSEAPTSDVTVSYRFLPGTGFVSSRASPSDAYNSQGLTNTVTFAAGETSKQVGLNIDADSTVEPDESIILEVFEVSGAGAILENDLPVLRKTSFILGDEGTGGKAMIDVSSPIIKEGSAGTQEMVFDVLLSRPLATEVTLDYQTIDGSAKAGSDYTATSGTITFEPGQTVAAVAVPISPDTTVEQREYFTLDIALQGAAPEVATTSDGIGTILDDDSNVPVVSLEGSSNLEGGFNDPFDLFWTITLSQAPTSDVTVEYRFLNGTADVSSSATTQSDAYNSLTGSIDFEAGETSKRVALNIDADDVAEFDESAVLEVFRVTGGDAILDGNAQVLSSSSFILGDDGTGLNTMLDVSSPILEEGDESNRQMVFDLALSRPLDAPVTVEYATVDGSARAGSDYTETKGSITFAAGQTKAAVSVDILGDEDTEPLESFTLDLTAPTEAVASVRDGIGSIQNDDFQVPPVATDDAVTLVQGQSGTFPASQLLANDTDANVEDVLIISDVGTGVNGTPVLNSDGSVTFTPADGFFGAASFEYTLSDQKGGLDVGKVDVTVTADFNQRAKDPAGTAPTDLGQIRDFDGNDLGNAEAWKLIGSVDIQFNGDAEYIYVNPTIERWATIGPDANGNIDFSDHGQGGDTRVVGIYIDPLVESGDVQQFSDFDSQRRFQNDLAIDNLTVIDAFDFDGDTFQEIYFKVNDGTAYLRALMHADGNIQYANYQNTQQVEDYLTGQGFGQDVLDTILI